MTASIEPMPPPSRRRLWPWVVLAFMIAPALWHIERFPDDVDPEYPALFRPTFNSFPPPAYRLAEPGDTIDRIAIYLSAPATVLSLIGVSLGGRREWLAALGIALGAFWLASCPWPTFDHWHGLGWHAILDGSTPPSIRGALAAWGLCLIVLVGWGVGFRPSGWVALLLEARANSVLGLSVVSGIFAILGLAGIPDVEPLGYWPRWELVWSLTAFSAVLVRLMPPLEGPGVTMLFGRASASLTGSLGSRLRDPSHPDAICRTTRWKPVKTLVIYAAATAVWLGLVATGIGISWLHRPLERFRVVVPGKIYMSAIPTERGLAIAHERLHFKTILNLFPENTPQGSPRLPRELAFALEHGIRYVGSPDSATESDEFLDLTLELARDPLAWPILVHCHGCMDRTPAWVGIYRFVVEGRPLDEVFRFIEAHRGYRPKASVTLLYTRVLPRLTPRRYRCDPTASLLDVLVHGASAPETIGEAESRGTANIRDLPRVGIGGPGMEAGGAVSEDRPSLTPRR